MRPLLFVLLGGVILAFGCGGAGTAPYRERPLSTMKDAGAEVAQAEKNAAGMAPQEGGEAPAAPPRKPVERKIIYNADLRIIVKDMAAAEEKLRQLITENEAFIASAESGGIEGKPRQGFWRVRVPVERFEAFVEGVANLGIAEKNRRDSQDVTEEYYDLADRIKNKQMEQETLRGYLQDKKATSKLEEILAVEKELSRVRGELDQMEGKLRLLSNMTALATVTITMVEDRDYVPPKTPSFGSSIVSTFNSSLNALLSFGKWLVLVLVAVIPWLVVLAVPAVPAWWMIRRFWTTTRASSDAVPTAEAAREPPSESS